ncbi:MAG: CoA ester lyase [Anaerolineaceae bacterium]|nr:CoA ester lyase [Anaerolineaceae bacterium]
MHARRALLYVPGDDLHKIQKSTTLGVDCICLDLEDGVAVNRKLGARDTIADALHALRFGQSERLVRINPLQSGLAEDDMAVVLPAHPDGIVLPKVESADQLQWINMQMAAMEHQMGWPIGSLTLLALIETPQAVIRLPEICTAVPRLSGLIFGAEDLAVGLGAQRTSAAWEVFYARSAIVLHTAAYNLQSIDLVSVDFMDIEALRQDSRQGADMGFTGKQIIHPNQVGPVQDAFTPSDEAIKEAQALIDAAAQYQQNGSGAFAVAGKMVDAPVVKLAQRLLDRARSAGKIQ